MPESVAGSNLILIIDDSVDAIRLLNCMLTEQGRVLSAIDGEAGLRLAKLQQPALILLDEEMPGMNGYEVCAALKADPTTQDLANRYGLVSRVQASHSSTQQLVAAANQALYQAKTDGRNRATVNNWS